MITQLALFLSLVSLPSTHQMDVPLVRQGKNLCGPAALEMLLRFWRTQGHDQYDIARNIIYENKNYFRGSGAIDRFDLKWSRYPGTAAKQMQKFMSRFAPTQMRNIPARQLTGLKAKQIEAAEFSRLKAAVSQGVPVLVIQKASKRRNNGHYRIVTGYNDFKQKVYLNDPSGGRKVVQSYSDFLELWRFKERNLAYSTLYFNMNKSMLKVVLLR